MNLLFRGPALRKAAIWGAKRAPLWFVRFAPTWIGATLSLFLAAERNQVRQNLRLIYGKRSFFRESLDIARTFIEFAHSMTAALAQSRFGPPEFEVRGSEQLGGRLPDSKGFILATCHVGSWDLVIQHAFAREGRSILVVMGHEGAGSGEAEHDRSREEQLGVVRVGAHPLEALPALRHLEQGGIVGTQLDRVPRGARAAEAELFGAKCPMAVGPLLLAAIARVPLVPVLTARLGWGKYLVQIEPPIELSPRPTDEELERALAPIARALEAHVRAFPTQWFAFR